MSASIEISDAQDRGRFELRVDGVLASIVDYRDRDGERIFPHTETLQGYGGRGHGTSVVRAALDEAVEQGRRIVPACPFVRAIVEQDRAAYGALLG